LPDRFKAQRRIHVEQLPEAADKLQMLSRSIAALTAAGYDDIGMDHFDALAVGQAPGPAAPQLPGLGHAAGWRHRGACRLDADQGWLGRARGRTTVQPNSSARRASVDPAQTVPFVQPPDFAAHGHSCRRACRDFDLLNNQQPSRGAHRGPQENPTS